MSPFLKASLLVSFCFLVFGCQKTTDFPEPPVANAGNDQTIQLPASSFILTGTGTTQNGSITGYLWSLVSGPNVPVITRPSSASTTVTGFVAGTYIFQFAVFDNAGLTGIDTTKVILNPAPIQTLTLFLENDDAVWLNFAGNASTNYSAHDIDLDAAAWTMGGNPFAIRGAFKFNLTAIPVNATILSAKLSLYSNPTPINGDQINANSGSNNSFYIRRIINSWNGATATWATQPSTTTSDQVQIAHTSQSFLDLIDVDVTGMVSNMVSGGNNGFMLTLQNETPYNIRQFCSSKHSNSSKKPKLVVTYQ